LFPVVNFLNVIEVVFFSTVAFNYVIPKGSVATRMRCGMVLLQMFF